MVRYFEACLNFMKTGHLPKELAEKTMNYFYAFGPKEIYEDDIEKLYAWASSIQILDFKLKRLDQFVENYMTLSEHDLIRNEQIERDMGLFTELVVLVTKIKDAFVPLGRPGRSPKLFEL